MINGVPFHWPLDQLHKRPILQQHGTWLDLLGLSVAKLYCVALCNGDRFAQWRSGPFPLFLASHTWLGMPNIVDDFMPNNSESDNLRSSAVNDFGEFFSILLV